MKTMMLGVLAAGLFASASLAQPEHSRRASHSTLTGDDDARVEVWRRGDVADPTVGAAAVRQPLLQIIFAGPGWQPAVKDSIVSDLSGLGMPSGIMPATIVGRRELAVPDAVNDLAIQTLLERSMREGSLPARDENVIHVILLSPGVRSTLGTFKAAADYDSYHSHVHAHDTNIRYVVVAWNDDTAAMREAAAASTLRAVLNPDGN